MKTKKKLEVKSIQIQIHLTIDMNIDRHGYRSVVLNLCAAAQKCAATIPQVCSESLMDI